MRLGALRRLRPALAVGSALFSLTAGFGAADLLSPFVLHEGTQVSDVGYGTLAGLVIPAGLLAQLGGAPWRAAGTRLVGAAALAYLAAGLLAREQALVAAGLVTSAVVIGLVSTGAAAGWTPSPSALVLGLAVLVALPGALYAFHMAQNQRDGAGTPDSHLGLGHWAALAAAALAAALAALLAGLEGSGSAAALPGLTASAAVLVWAVTCLVYPGSAGALGAGTAVAAIAWSLAFAGATLRAARPGA